MSGDFAPMLAERKNPDLEKLDYVLAGSPKLDGIRCVIRNGAKSRSLLPIANEYIREFLSQPQFEGLDGELIVGEPTDKQVYNTTNSAVMSKKGQPEFRYFVFDDFTRPDLGYAQRIERMMEKRFHLFDDRIVYHEDTKLYGPEQVLSFEEHILNLGYEGVILRHLEKPYKFGRSTAKEQGMLKLKRFVDKEFEIVGTVELQHNENEAGTNELGRTKRSKAQEGMVAGDTLGALVCKLGDLTFEVGTGYTAAQRKQLWETRDSLIGKLAKVKYFEPGSKDRPRHPVFLGLRNKEDM